MATAEWGALTPAKVADWINFDRNDATWHYTRCNPISMPARQAEGVAGLWNKLAQHNVALLADEVGMGKTLQALGVMALLWKMNPDARVLVMAPNRDICAHWMREYRAFLREHYRDVDHLVRNIADGGAVHEPALCRNLAELTDTVATGAGQFYLTTIHALSGLADKDAGSKAEKLRSAEKAACRIHKSLKTALGNAGFDLIIVDEAHYFRNADGDSQRAHTARTFFGDADNRLAQKVLLMTATPSHSSMADVPNILGYFTAPASDEPPDSIALLKQYALRRLRLMQGANGFHNKYHYRNENALPASFDNDPEAELFFALYQKKLVQEQGQSGNKRRYLYGYLEGFESVGNREEQAAVDVLDDDSDGSSQAFTNAPDTAILDRITRQYVDVFAKFPEHPKYNALVRECVPVDVFDATTDLHEHKHLVFVRRIPSVREITQRINAAYDQMLARRIIAAWAPANADQVLAEWQRRGWSRAAFNTLVKSLSAGAPADEELLPGDDEFDGDDAGLETEHKLAARIADLFVVKKTGSERSTDCSNVSLRFRKSESLFSLLLEPATDYRDGAYRYHYRKRIGERDRDVYGEAALDCRLRLHDRYTQKSELGATAMQQEHAFAQPLPTAWGLMFHLLPHAERERLQAWIKRDPAIAENFANYIKAGFVFASPVMVELYCWYTEFSRASSTTDAQQRYLDFVGFIEPRLRDSLMLQYFIAALDTFETLCEKITDHALSDWQKDWRVLTSLQNPAWYASGESGNRQRLILGFNSPFYPNVLVATSVFQEGVNLHLQCRKVHHYGIAWTPGDNEQRVGRVDRLFGRVNTQLTRDGVAELGIHYPYLTRSFDQEQLASFILLKHGVEARMDACRHHEFDDAIDIQNAAEQWRDYLRKPDFSAAIADPYPALFERATMPAKPYQPAQVSDGFNALDYLGGLLASVIDSSTDSLFKVARTEQHPNVLGLIDAVVTHTGRTRHQPCVAEINFLPELSALVSGTVYLLTLRSPLATYIALEQSGQADLTAVADAHHAIMTKYPMVSIALDDSRKNSHFYLHARVDLPLFVLNGDSRMLSSEEVAEAYQQLRHAADALEWQLFDGQQDLAREDLAENRHAQQHDFVAHQRSETRRKKHSGWNQQPGIQGDVAVLEKRLSTTQLVQLAQARLSGRHERVSIQAMLRLNNALPMLRFYADKKNIVMRLTFPADDMQDKEQHLLERWFDHVGRVSV